MPRLIAPILFLAAATANPSGTAAQAPDQRRGAASPGLIRAAVAERDAREQARRRCAAGEMDLRQRILAGTADAERESDAAVSRGCFGLITTFSSIPTGVAYGVGVACRPNQELFAYGRLHLLSFSGSDGVTLDAEQAERDRRSLETIRAFALTYNRAIIARPEFPHHDLCRVAADAYSPGISERLVPGEWGYRGLEETDAPIDISEAARRGTLASLRRLIEARPIELHVPDLLGLTPLAWAVIYNRPEHARLLLEAGAHPYGEPYREQAQEGSPILIAREERNRAMTQLIRPFLEARGLPIPPVEARLDQARSSPYLFTPQRGWTRAGARLTISPEGRVSECHFEGTLGTPADCDRARRGLFYLPAEDEDGRAERGSGFFYLPVNQR